MRTKWISLTKRQPLPGISVLALLDYTPYGRHKRVLIADVHLTNDRIAYGGPMALTGHGFLTGLYFSVPAILAPGVVTHWMELPEII